MKVAFFVLGAVELSRLFLQQFVEMLEKLSKLLGYTPLTAIITLLARTKFNRESSTAPEYRARNNTLIY